jgi:purine-binding chemotaxis protein CheW
MTPSSMKQLVTFTVNNHKFGVDLSCVERAVLVVEISPLPSAPSNVMGIISVEGQTVPVINPRKILHLPDREPVLSDHLIIINTKKRTVALLVDEVSGIMEYSSGDETTAESILSDSGSIYSIIRKEGHFIYIQDVERFLALEQDMELESAINDHQKIPVS